MLKGIVMAMHYFFAQFQSPFTHDIHHKTLKISKILLLVQFIRALTHGVTDQRRRAPVLVSSFRNLNLHVE